MKTDISLYTLVEQLSSQKSRPKLNNDNDGRSRSPEEGNRLQDDRRRIYEGYRYKNSKNRYLKSEENILRSKVLSINKFPTVKD